MALRRKHIIPLFLAGAALGAGALTAWDRNRRRAAVPEPARPVNLEAYLGRWYEIGRYENRFERNCEAATAEYGLREDGLIDVVNTCHEGSPSGPLKTARGRARVVAGSDGAKLKVSFFGPFFIGDYWILDHAEDYAWSIVGEPSGRFLWLLSREPHPPEAIHQEIVARAGELGYDLGRIRTTLHEAGPVRSAADAGSAGRPSAASPWP